MKKVLVVMLVVGLVFGATLLSTATAADTNANRGGIMGFVAGCCFGIRAGMDYNDGKEIHWREWCRIVPVVSLVISIWDGIDGMNGMTRSYFTSKYGASYY